MAIACRPSCMRAQVKFGDVCARLTEELQDARVAALLRVRGCC